MNDYILKAENLNYKNIFTDFNISIKNNQFVTISGTNKCGKTTLIKLLSGEIKTINQIKINDLSLENYLVTELYQYIGIVIPKENRPFIFNTVEQELMFVLESVDMSVDLKTKRYKEIVKLFKLNKYLSSNPNELYVNLKVRLYLALATLLKPEILFLDDVCSKMTKTETKEIINLLKYFKEEEKMTIIMSTDNLNDALDSDYLYIISEGKIVLEGEPLQVLEKDNILNRLGLNLPFMVDLSVKLRDYDLIDHIELDMDRMVNTLWK